MSNYNKNLFFEYFEKFVENNELVKLTIGNKRDKKNNLNKINIFPVKIKKGFMLSFVYKYKTKDITKNFNPDDAVFEVKKLLKTEFLNAELFTTEEIIRLYLFPDNEKKAKLKISEQTFKPVINLNHDKNKIKRIKKENNIWMRELGMLTEKEEIKKGMHDKYRQINKYLEILETNIINKISKKHISVVDAGSGKGYLTFALYDFLNNNLKINAKITGIELRKELTDICNDISKKAGFSNLNFIQGNIINTEIKKTDIYIALHACDTATDEAIFNAVKSKSRFIAVAPCCQKQIRKQMNTTGALAQITKHGILKEQQAVILTDGLRALILEKYGYKTKVFEFISTEHTPKNTMIIAEKSKKHIDKQQITNSINKIKTMFGIKYHYLEKLFENTENF